MSDSWKRKSIHMIWPFLVFFLIAGCHQESKEKVWNVDKLYEVKQVEEFQKGDTIVIKYQDESYVLFEEYCKWKTDYFVWLNDSKLEEGKVYRISNSMRGRGDIDHLYTSEEILKVKRLYDTNESFRQITEDVFAELTISEISTLIRGNQAINEARPAYKVDLQQLMIDYSVCKDTCPAVGRINLLGEMLNELKLNHFWHDSVLVEPCHLVGWLHSLPNGLIKIEEREYCERDLLGKSNGILSQLIQGGYSEVLQEFYSEEFLHELAISNQSLQTLHEQIHELQIQDHEMIVVKEVKTVNESRTIPMDSLDVVQVYFPLIEKRRPEVTVLVFMLAYVIKQGEYKAVGYQLYDPSFGQIAG